MKHYVFTIMLLLVASVAYGQKANQKKAKTAIGEENPNFKDAFAAIDAAMKDPTTMNDPETYNLAGKLSRKAYEMESMKHLKKEPYDTARLYNSVLEMFKYYEICDEKAQIPDEKGKLPKNKWREENTKDLEKYYGQLFNAGAVYYMMQKKDYPTAVRFLGEYIDKANSPLLKNLDLLTDSAKNQTAFYATYAAYYAKDDANIIKYGEMAINCLNKTDSEKAFQILTHAYKNEGDTAKWIYMLQEGIKRDPTAESNIVQLINYYNDKGKIGEAMKFADQLIEADPDNDYSYFIKGVLLQQGTKDVAGAIECYKKAIAIDPKKSEYYSNLGTSYIAVAQELDGNSVYNSPEYKNQQRLVMQNYMWAREAFEKVRDLAPEKEDLWVAPLYRIYYKLGIQQGEEFQELQKKMEAREGVILTQPAKKAPAKK